MTPAYAAGPRVSYDACNAINCTRRSNTCEGGVVTSHDEMGRLGRKCASLNCSKVGRIDDEDLLGSVEFRRDLRMSCGGCPNWGRGEDGVYP